MYYISQHQMSMDKNEAKIRDSLHIFKCWCTQVEDSFCVYISTWIFTKLAPKNLIIDLTYHVKPTETTEIGLKYLIWHNRYSSGSWPTRFNQKKRWNSNTIIGLTYQIFQLVKQQKLDKIICFTYQIFQLVAFSHNYQIKFPFGRRISWLPKIFMNW